MLNVGFLGSVIALTLLAIREEIKLAFVGILCAAFTIGMYASPLSIMGMVIKTKSVEYMPFLLSFFLLLNGGIWSLYALLVKDFYVGIPNAIGLVLGSAQIIIYSIYKNKSKKSTETTEEVDSATNLVEKAVEMHANRDGDNGLANLKNRSLLKEHSLPKPIVNRLYTMPTKIMKTLSLRSQDRDSVRDLEDDLEKGAKNHP
ncbi:hypothetical protein TIFTF001_013139 [Ficus carica]|uniref:Bidirectional sugar transporter SWEET n=1 Tax=Ficus carica TaxID=3494 RepID=A0AA87ZUE4_FICCA|nr:hypothetical protein TIFTF001_013139 [Ficus carica]